ncbi:MAG: ribbon-helix-helix domain-containing protein [Pseudolabrys sp.]
MKSQIIKRSVVIRGHKTSVSLEQPFWDAFRDIAESERVSTSALLRKVDAERNQANMSSAIRVFVLRHVRTLATTEQRRPEGERDGAGGWWSPSPINTI